MENSNICGIWSTPGLKYRSAILFFILKIILRGYSEFQLFSFCWWPETIHKMQTLGDYQLQSNIDRIVDCSKRNQIDLNILIELA